MTLSGAACVLRSRGPITVRGERHRVDDNLLQRGCLSFENEAGHGYRDNVVASGPEGICGHANRDGGGNVYPPPTCGNRVKAVSEVCDQSLNG